MNEKMTKIRWILALLLVLPLMTWSQSTGKKAKTPSVKVVKETATSSKSKSSKKVEIEIKKLEITTERTPSAEGSKKGSQGSGTRWLCVRAQIDMSGREWLDTMDAHWSVVIDADSGKKPFLMELDTSFINIKKGNKNRITAYVDPVFFERYMNTESVNTNKVTARLELKANGKVVARKTEGKKGALISQPGKCMTAASTLLPKSKTPFAQVDFDYYLKEKAE